jgi:hypothetical protein
MALNAQPLDRDALLPEYDIALGAIGFEARARFAYSELTAQAKIRSAIRFSDRRIHDFAANDAFFADAGFASIEADPSAVRTYLATRLAALAQEESHGGISILVDISSLTRQHIAIICYEVIAHRELCSSATTVDFVYSPAQYAPPPAEFGPIQVREPIIPELSGWSADADLPTALVFGIGYEPDIALGLEEEMEPGDVVVFRPAEHDPRYDAAIDEQNREFLSKMPPNKIVCYNVFDPFTLYAKLANVVSGLQRDCRTTLIPLGPKIFTLCSILCGFEWLPAVSVWRVSAAEFAEPTNRVPLGTLEFLRVVVQPTCLESAATASLATRGLAYSD